MRFEDPSGHRPLRAPQDFPIRWGIADMVVVLFLANLHVMALLPLGRDKEGGVVICLITGISGTLLPAYLSYRYITEKRIQSMRRRIVVLLSVELAIYGVMFGLPAAMIIALDWLSRRH